MTLKPKDLSRDKEKMHGKYLTSWWYDINFIIVKRKITAVIISFMIQDSVFTLVALWAKVKSFHLWESAMCSAWEEKLFQLISHEGEVELCVLPRPLGVIWWTEDKSPKLKSKSPSFVVQMDEEIEAMSKFEMDKGGVQKHVTTVPAWLSLQKRHNYSSPALGK